ncbi:MAG: hypothetical protein NTW06_00110 [Candidatus Falkowbacteria bacterium]|nr:hypothetical protein [Candidatus Falkowbacteria bacterium]
MAKIICAWCDDLIGFNPSSSGITHGICQICYEKELEKLENISEEKKLELKQLDDDKNEK